MVKVQWRLNDPGVDPRRRWTKVHRVSIHADDLTMCHIIIPDAYDMNVDQYIADDAPQCKSCLNPPDQER